MGKRVTCAHCECSFSPENGATLDDCPKCGRTVEVPPDHIADATKMVQPAPLHESEDVMEALSVVAATGLSGTAEARVRELEATIDTMAEAHAHDDMALTAAYLNGAHAGKKDAEAFKARVMEWARGRCCTCRWDCAHPQPGKPSCNVCSNGDKGDWTPAWEVKS